MLKQNSILPRFFASSIHTTAIRPAGFFRGFHTLRHSVRFTPPPGLCTSKAFQGLSQRTARSSTIIRNRQATQRWLRIRNPMLYKSPIQSKVSQSSQSIEKSDATPSIQPRQTSSTKLSRTTRMTQMLKSASSMARMAPSALVSPVISVHMHYNDRSEFDIDARLRLAYRQRIANTSRGVTRRQSPEHWSRKYLVVIWQNALSI